MPSFRCPNCHHKIKTLHSSIPLPEFRKDWIDPFLEYLKNMMKTKQKHGSNARIRLPNCPEHISENLVALAIYHHYGVMPARATLKQSGDLRLDCSRCDYSLDLEVKGSINLTKGLPSFSPNPKWDRLYFIDCQYLAEGRFRVHELPISGQKFTTLKVNSTQTYQDQIDQKRRPRATFKMIENHFKAEMKVIFDGSLDDLTNPQPKIPSNKKKSGTKKTKSAKVIKLETEDNSEDGLLQLQSMSDKVVLKEIPGSKKIRKKKIHVQD